MRQNKMAESDIDSVCSGPALMGGRQTSPPPVSFDPLQHAPIEQIIDMRKQLAESETHLMRVEFAGEQDRQ